MRRFHPLVMMRGAAARAYRRADGDDALPHQPDGRRGGRRRRIRVRLPARAEPSHADLDDRRAGGRARPRCGRRSTSSCTPARRRTPARPRRAVTRRPPCAARRGSTSATGRSSWRCRRRTACSTPCRMVDLWTNTFASVGARTTGTRSGAYVINGPRSPAGAHPDGMVPIAAPTEIIRISGLTQVDAIDGFAAAHAVQDGYRLFRLGERPARRPRRRAAAPPPTAGRPSSRSSGWTRGRSSPSSRGSCATTRRGSRTARWSTGCAGSGCCSRPTTTGRGSAATSGRRSSRARGSGSSGSWRWPRRRPGEPVGDWRIRFRLGAFGTDYLAPGRRGVRGPRGRPGGRPAAGARAHRRRRPAADRPPALRAALPARRRPARPRLLDAHHLRRPRSRSWTTPSTATRRATGTA